MSLDAAMESIPALLAEVRGMREEVSMLRELVTATSSRWLSRRDAAEALGVSTDTIDRRIADGALRVQRLGRTVRVLVAPPAADPEIARLAAGARRP